MYNVDPSLPLASGIRHYVDGWAGRILIHKVHQAGGLEVLSLSFALLFTCIAIIWSRLYVTISGRFWFCLASIVWIGICFQQLSGLSTHSLGFLCFTALVACTVGLKSRTPESPNSAEPFEISVADFSWPSWLAALLIGVAWVNLDGSFLIGWIWAAALLISRSITLLVQRLDTNAVRFWADRELKSRLLLLELLILASICNPLGIKIFGVFFWWPDHPFVASMAAFKPIVLFSWQGAGLAITILAWFLASRFANNVRAWQLFSVVLGILAVSLSSSFLIWVLPVIILATCAMLAPNELADSNLETETSILTSESNSTNQVSTIENPTLRFAFTLVCCLAVWVSFTFSPASHLLLGGKSRSADQILGPANPIEAVEVVKKNPDKNGLLWCPSYWSDRVQDIENPRPVFANANMHSIPKQALFDYEILYNGDNGWLKVLDRYRITEMMIDKRRQTRMLHNLRAKAQGWVRIHEDEKAVVFRKSSSDAS